MKKKEKEHGAIEMWKKEIGKRKMGEGEIDKEGLEKEVECLEDTCATILETFTEKANITARSKRWWNDDIKQQRKTLE